MSSSSSFPRKAPARKRLRVSTSGISRYSQWMDQTDCATPSSQCAIAWPIPSGDSVSRHTSCSAFRRPSQSHVDHPPFLLPEAQHAQHATRHMSSENGKPDVNRFELPRLLNHETDAE